MIIKQSAPEAQCYDHLRAALAPELADYRRGVDLYRALCNNIWVSPEHPDLAYSWRSAGQLVADLRTSLDLPRAPAQQCQNCQEDKSQHLVEKRTFTPFFSDQPIEISSLFCDEDKQERFIPGYQGPEDYLDFYCSGDEGLVSEWVEERLTAAGYRRQK
jgi:hypothetical protein